MEAVLLPESERKKLAKHGHFDHWVLWINNTTGGHIHVTCEKCGQRLVDILLGGEGSEGQKSTK
jgi:hypothetical protein